MPAGGRLFFRSLVLVIAAAFSADATSLAAPDPPPAPALGPPPGKADGLPEVQEEKPPRGRDKKDDAVLHALKWLAAHQSEDGRWSSEGFAQRCDGQPNTSERPDGLGRPGYDVGLTGLALCAFLGAGYTNRGKHEFAPVVRRGLAFLISCQDGEGCLGPRDTQRYVYNHAIAALALVENFGMTEGKSVQRAAQKALDFLALVRNPDGAWRYGVKTGESDTSVTGWMASVLLSARLINEDAVKRGNPAPLSIDEQAFDGIRTWIAKMTDPKSGRVGYTTIGSGPWRPEELRTRFPAGKSEALTAVGMFCRIILREDPKQSRALQQGSRLLAAALPAWKPDGSIDMHAWYFGTLAAQQLGGDLWAKWEPMLETAVADNQRTEGTYCGVKGSWDPVDPWGPDGGRVYSTAILCRCLEAEYLLPEILPKGK
jgi:hypothetical protein